MLDENTVAYRNNNPYRLSHTLNETYQHVHNYVGTAANKGSTAFRNK